jgi:malate dehydrogenase (oxaloacetate-decarboxylating)
VAEEELDEDYIVPSVFNRDVGTAVARAVAEEAERTGASRATGKPVRRPGDSLPADTAVIPPAAVS